MDKYTLYQRQEMIKNYIAAYNNFDIENMFLDFDDHIIFENIYDGKKTNYLKGLNDLKQLAETSKKIFKHRKQTIKLFRHKLNTTEIEVEFEAILASELNSNGVEKHIKLQGISIFEFENDKIIKLTDLSYSL